ncbi:uncharacterized protein wu:fa19b12 [Plectropomus leopardus]|uniref:uncharacterized protein wu:fa19b12 n=1 Tax=Plectropomus leopardus TaxID=160734 RepID=UPI001C4C79AC|nr:uncharacterized protein wu:fa19b12 [Plectropomus leopardus]
MAKRRAEDTLLHDSPSKRCYRLLSSVDMQLDSMAPAGGVNPPSLLALLGSRCRKRPYYFEEPEKQDEAALYRKPRHCDTRKPAANVLAVNTSGSFQDCRSSKCTLTSSKKRPRDDCTGSETVIPKATDDKAEDTDTEDCTYNSFQYWRVPLPEVNLSLLEDATDHSQTKDKSKVKDSFSDAMET